MQERTVNVDGAVRDEDTFAIGDDEDDESGDEFPSSSDIPGPPPPYTSDPTDGPVSITTDESSSTGQLNTETPPNEGSRPPTPKSVSDTDLPAPSKYYIQPNDNLQGIALRFGLKVSLLVCTPWYYIK